MLGHCMPWAAADAFVVKVQTRIWRVNSLCAARLELGQLIFFDADLYQWSLAWLLLLA